MPASFLPIVGALLFMILSYLALHFYLAYSSLHMTPVETGQTPRDYGIDFKKFRTVTNDKYKLAGWYMVNETKNKGTVVLLHNLGACKRKLLPYARFLYSAGYNVALFDFRSHGESDKYLPFWDIIASGDSDLMAVVNDIKNTEWFKKTNRNIGLMGFSMGTIPAISMTGRIPEIKAVVVDCGPFVSLSKIFSNMLARTIRYHKLLIPFVYVSFIRFMLNRNEDCIKKSVSNISPKAVFFIHGEKDFIVPPSETKILYDEYARQPKEYWLVPGSYHLTAHSLYPDEYRDRVLNFFSRHLP